MDWAAIVDTEGSALADAVARDGEAAVPACDGWTTTDLLRHVGLLHARTELTLREGLTERPSRSAGNMPVAPDTGLLEWYRETLAALVAQFRSVEPDRPSWSFAPEHQRAGFWPRRMTHETTVHRVDAQQAVGGTVEPVESALGVDGVDEILGIFVPALASDRSPGDGRTVHLHATDAEGEWLVAFGPDGVVVTSGHAKGDAAVRGPAGQLFLWLWGRGSLDDLEVFGDRAAAEALRVVTTF